MAQAVAITLVKFRRRRPSRWLRIIVAAYLLYLGWIARSAIGVARGHWLYLPVGLLMTLQVLPWHRAFVRLRDAVRNDLPLPPLSTRDERRAWLYLIFFYVLLALAWANLNN